MTDAEQKAAEILDKAAAEEEPQQHILSRGQVRELEQKDAYLITSAQNNTAVHERVWRTLQRIAEFYDAQLLVIPIRYKNPTGYAPDLQGRNDRWAESLRPWMVENQVRIHRKLVVMGQWRLAATTQRPLTGKGPITGSSSAIFGHGRLQMQTIATPGSELPKLLYSTGSVTEPNYSDSDLGQKGRFHHTQGAVLVRKVNGLFHIRHLNWSEKDGSICDLNHRFTPDGVQETNAIAIVTGDEHAIWNEPVVRTATYGPGGLVELTKPRFIVRHDVFDNYAVSGHHRDNPIFRHVKSREGYNCLESELRLTVDHIDTTTPESAQNVIVASNHHEHLMQWLRLADPKLDSKNAPLYHKLMALVMERSEMRHGGVWTPDAFALWSSEYGHMRSDTRFLERNESFVIHEIEMGLHGDKGPDGRWGTPTAFSQMGIKTITAHRHSPHIFDGNYCVGHSRSQWAEYVQGPSSWLPTHCLVHQNGKRQLVHVINGAF